MLAQPGGGLQHAKVRLSICGSGSGLRTRVLLETSVLRPAMGQRLYWRKLERGRDGEAMGTRSRRRRARTSWAAQMKGG